MKIVVYLLLIMSFQRVLAFESGRSQPLDNQNLLNQNLIRAIGENNLEATIDLLRQGADVNATDQDGYGYPALFWATLDGHVDCLKVLLEAGADMSDSSEDDPTTVFNMALLREQYASARMLIECSYVLVSPPAVVSQARERILNVLLQFIWLRNHHPELANLRSESLHFEIFSKNRVLGGSCTYLP